MDSHRRAMAAIAAATALTVLGAGVALAAHLGNPDDAHTRSACHPDRSTGSGERRYGEIVDHDVPECGSERAGYLPFYMRHMHDNAERSTPVGLEYFQWRNLVDPAIGEAPGASGSSGVQQTIDRGPETIDGPARIVITHTGFRALPGA